MEDENSACNRRAKAPERQSVEARKSCGEAQARMCMGSQKRQACSQELLFEPFPSPPQPYSFSLGESLSPRASSIYLPKMISSIYLPKIIYQPLARVLLVDGARGVRSTMELRGNETLGGAPGAGRLSEARLGRQKPRKVPKKCMEA